MKIKCLNAISEKGTRLMEGYEFTEDLKEADAVLVRSAKMHELEVGDRLLCVARAGAGVNNIPSKDYAEKGIVVFNTPGANANAVKELVICALLLGSRDIHGGIKWVTENAGDEDIEKSVEKAKKAFAGREIKGKTLGIVGLGAIGAIVAEAALALGMDVIGYDPFLSVDAAWRIPAAAEKLTDLKKLAARSDYITIHVPATSDTKGIISSEIIAAMKPDAVLINFSRDTLVDEEALTDALEAGKIGRYITDFANPKSVHMKNTLVLPHLGASTEESEENCAVKAAIEVMDYIENGNIINSVNFPSVNLEKKAGPRVSVLAKEGSDITDNAVQILSKTGIAQIASAERGGFACVLAELKGEPDAELIEKLTALAGVVRVRAV